MLKLKILIYKNSKSDFKFFSKSFSNDILNSMNQPEKTYIHNLIMRNKNTEIAKNNLLESFLISDFYSIFLKMKNKTVINYPFDSFSKTDSFEDDKLRNKLFLKKFFELLLNENYIYKKIEKIPLNTNQSTNETEKTNYYLKLNNSKFLEQIGKSMEDCRLSKQTYKWHNSFLQEQEKLLEKNFRLNVRFEFRDQSIKGKENISELIIEVPNPEYLYGATFIVLKSQDDFFKKFPLNKINLSEKNSYVLPSTYYAINPLNNDKIQILILDETHQLSKDIDLNLRACVPGHNEIDYKLAKEFSLPIKFIVQPVHQMSKQLDAKLKDSTNIEDIIKIKSTSLEEIKDTLKSNDSKSPLILNDTDGYLIGCKEFDYLYLNEAKELIAKNLIRRNKAICEKSYNITDPLIACEKKTNQTETSINFTEIFELSANIFYLSADESKESSISIDKIKRFFPIDLVINVITDKMPSKPNYAEVLFYSRVLYLIITDILNVNKIQSIWADPNVQSCSEEVVLNSSKSTRNDLIYSEPFKEIIEIRIKEQNFAKFNYSKIDDISRFNFFYTISGNKNRANDISSDTKQIIKKLFHDLSNLHLNIIKQLSTQEFDLDKVRDEKFNINKLNNNLIIEINTLMIDVIKKIDREKSKLSESASEMINLFDLISAHYLILKDHFNYLVFIYFNYLMILNPFCPNLAGDLYKDLRENTGKAFNKENLSEYSLLKLQETSNFFIEMIKNTVVMNIIINGNSQGNVMFSKAYLDNKVLMLQIIKDTLLLDNNIFDKHYEIDIRDGEVKITTGID